MKRIIMPFATLLVLALLMLQSGLVALSAHSRAGTPVAAGEEHDLAVIVREFGGFAGAREVIAVCRGSSLGNPAFVETLVAKLGTFASRYRTA